MSQQNEQLRTATQSIHRTLEEAYLGWYDNKVAANIEKPIEKNLAQFRRASMYSLTGYYEQIIMKLIAYRNYSMAEIKQEDSHDSNLNDSNAYIPGEDRIKSSNNRLQVANSSQVQSMGTGIKVGKYNSSAATGVVENSSQANASNVFNRLTHEVKAS